MIDASGDADVAHYCGAPYRKTAVERMLPVTVMFSGAGVAAALSIRSGTPVRHVSVTDLQRELARQGVRLH